MSSLEPIRILLDARKIGDGGIGVYIENLVDGLLKLEDQGRAKPALSLLVPETFFEDSALSTHFRIHGQGALMRGCQTRWAGRVKFVAECSPKYSLREYFLLGLRQKSECREHDVFHSPHYTLPYFLGLPAVVTIHDVIHITHPENFYHRPIASMMIRSALRRAAHVITVSDQSAQALRKITGRFDKPVTVVPNALRPNFRRQADDKVQDFLRREFLTRKYCLFVGSERLHKGFWELIDAWTELKASGEDFPDLVVVGKNFFQARDSVSERKLDNCVRFFGEVNLDKLMLLYSGASAVIVPSKVEGFGLPALEGMGLGVPVICAPIPSLREVCRDAAVYANEISGRGFAEAVRAIHHNSDLAALKAKEGLLRSRCFTVEACAERTWNVYGKVLGRTSEGSDDRADNLASCC